MDYLVLVFMLLYSAFLFDWCAPKQIYKKIHLSLGLSVPHQRRQIFCCDELSLFTLNEQACSVSG